MKAGPVRVLVVDDSLTIRSLLRTTIESDPRLAVAGEAADPYDAREKIKTLNPDVITLDIEMPRMNGLDFLERLMRLRPMPVVMVSTRTRDKSVEAIQALSLGAVDCVDVSRLQVEPGVRRRLLDTLVLAGGATVSGPRGQAVRDAAAHAGRPERGFTWNGRFVVIGSSTGGVDALERVLAAFPANCPPTLIAQHMPPGFLESFARRLDAAMAPDVAIAGPSEELRPGRVLLAGGGSHHLVLRNGSTPRTAFAPSQPDDMYVPAVDQLFHSAVPFAHRVVAVILTGMGRDGSRGLLALREAGARTLAQSAETCVIDGMPRAARDLDAVQESIPIGRIGRHVVELCARVEAAQE